MRESHVTQKKLENGEEEEEEGQDEYEKDGLIVDDVNEEEEERDEEEEGRASSDEERKKKKKKRESEKNYVLDEDDYDLLQDNNVKLHWSKPPVGENYAKPRPCFFHLLFKVVKNVSNWILVGLRWWAEINEPGQVCGSLNALTKSPLPG